MATSFRTAAWNLSPSRLREPSRARRVYAFIGLPLDALVAAATAAVKCRFPDVCPEDVLPEHGRDRGIRRGPREPADSYRGRLLLWLESWLRAGVGRGMPDQLAGYITPRTCRIRIITQAGLVYTREADGSFSVERTGNTWDWDGQSELWARVWVVIYPGADLWTTGPTWGSQWGGTWGSSGCTWGTTATPDEVASVRAIVHDWKPAATKCEGIIVAFDEASFDAAGTDWPDGACGYASKWDAGTSTRVRARVSTARYWNGVG